MRRGPYMRTGEVARAPGHSRETVRGRINAGEFGDFLFDEGVGYLVSSEAVVAWIRARTIRVATRQEVSA